MGCARGDRALPSLTDVRIEPRALAGHARRDPRREAAPLARGPTPRCPLRGRPGGPPFFVPHEDRRADARLTDDLRTPEAPPERESAGRRSRLMHAVFGEHR